MSKWTRYTLSAALSGAALIGAAGVAEQVAQAQEVSQNFDIERFRLSVDRNGILDSESAELPAHLEWEVSAWFGYEDDPLVLVRSGTDDRVGALVSHRLAGSLLASIGLWERLELGLALPLTLSQSANDVGPVSQGSLSSFGVGDLRLLPKIAILPGGLERTGVAFAMGVTVPTAGSDDYLGTDGPSLRPEIIVSHRRRAWRANANLAYQTRRREILANIEVDDELRFRLGAGVTVAPRWEVEGSISAATLGKSPFKSGQKVSSELLGGVAFTPNDMWQFFAAGGPGLANGFGTPDFRALAGLRFRGSRSDESPAETEPSDQDGDGLVNHEDACPEQPETRNGFEDDDGCPDEEPLSDTDGDGFMDADDSCPSEPEDRDTFEDEDGCPDPDNDGDGVLDVDDACPLEAGVPAERGCPMADRDGDTVADPVDNCPDEPGKPEFQGCNKKSLVKITGSSLEILDRVFFRTNKAQILNTSYEFLDNVADVIKAHPEIEKIRVEGHTDSRGNDKANKRLSQRRADSVKAYLVKRGVSADRLEAVGFGEEKPIDSNDTDEGRSANRRVEFKIIGAEGEIQERNSGPSEESMDGN